MGPLWGIPAVLVLAAVAGSAVKRRRARKRQQEALSKVDMDRTRKDAAMLIALGYDPGKHRILPVMRPHRGLRIVDDRGQPLGFFTERTLRTPVIRSKWQKALRTLTVKA